MSEGLSASCLLLKLAAAVDLGAAVDDSSLSSLWTCVLDMDRQLFVSDKFLAMAGPESLGRVIQLCERLLMDHGHRLNGTARPIHRAIIQCLASPITAVRSRYST